MTDRATHAFVAFRRCGLAMLIEVDEGARLARDTLDEFLTCLRDGGRIGYMPIEEARKLTMCFVDCEACK